MIISIDKDQLLECLTSASSVISSKVEYPYLTGIHFTAKKDKLTLEATDQNSSVRVCTSALVEKEGKSLINARKLSSIVKVMPEGAVCIAVENRQAIISCGSSDITIPVFDEKDFPLFPSLETKETITLPKEVFTESVQRISSAAAKEGAERPLFVGVFMQVKDSQFLLVSTDGFRMMTIEAEVSIIRDFEAIVPAQALRAIASFPEESESITIGIKENQVVFEFGSIRFISRKLKGSFPDHTKIFAGEHRTKAFVFRDDLLEAVKRAITLASGVARLTLQIDPEKKAITIVCDGEERGSSVEIITCREIEGQYLEIAFSTTFFSDAINSSRGDFIELAFRGNMDPAVITSTSGFPAKHMVLPRNPKTGRRQHV